MERTDLLAASLGVSLRALAPKLDLSVASLFGYRNGSIKISAKAWSKLERLELISCSKIAGSYGNPKERPLGETTHQGLRSLPAPGKDSPTHRMIPVIGMAHAGEAENYDEVPDAWRHHLATDCRDPKAFGVILEGDSMEPKFSEGDWLVVQPSEVPHSGCLVVARFANDGVIFRRFEQTGKRIILMPLNPRYEASQHTEDEFLWIYPVWGRWTPIWRR